LFAFSAIALAFHLKALLADSRAEDASCYGKFIEFFQENWLMDLNNSPFFTVILFHGCLF